MSVKKNLTCTECGNQGWALWDKREPVATSNGFYLRVPTGYFGNRQIVCDVCGATQQNAILGADALAEEKTSALEDKSRAQGNS